jgi:uncharacterized protein
MLALANRKAVMKWARTRPKLAPVLEAAERNGQNEKDAAHDLSHLWRVAYWTIRLAPEVDPEEAVAAALMHDHVNVPKNHPDRAKASTLSAEAALPFLKAGGFSPEAILRIQAAIRDHSFSRGAIPEEALGKALQDADRLEALGAIGLMRVFATGARMNTGFFDPEDPWAESRELDDKKYSVDHFFTKLLKLPATFQTEAGRREAARRAATLENFLDTTAEELGEPRP